MHIRFIQRQTELDCIKSLIKCGMKAEVLVSIKCNIKKKFHLKNHYLKTSVWQHRKLKWIKLQLVESLRRKPKYSPIKCGVCCICYVLEGILLKSIQSNETNISILMIMIFSRVIITCSIGHRQPVNVYAFTGCIDIHWLWNQWMVLQLCKLREFHVMGFAVRSYKMNNYLSW